MCSFFFFHLMKTAPTSGVHLLDQRCFVVLSVVRLWSLYLCHSLFLTLIDLILLFFSKPFVAHNYLQRCKEGGREGTGRQPTINPPEGKVTLSLEDIFQMRWQIYCSANALWNNLMSFMLFVACQRWWWRNWFDMTDLCVCMCVCGGGASVRVRRVCVCACTLKEKN